MPGVKWTAFPNSLHVVSLTNYFKRTECYNIDGYAKSSSQEYLHRVDSLSVGAGRGLRQKKKNHQTRVVYNQQGEWYFGKV